MGADDPKQNIPPSTDKPFEQVRLKLDDTLVQQWKPEMVNGDWIFSGNCPRCGHLWEKAVRDEVMVIAFEAETPAPENEGTYVVQCNCPHAHPGRPDDVSSGCGAYWGIRVRRTGGSGSGS